MDNRAIQYTIRNVPPAVDQVIRKRAKLTGKSFNQVAIESLSKGALGTDESQSSNPFDELFGASTLDEAFDEAIAEFSKPDPKLWQ